MQVTPEVQLFQQDLILQMMQEGFLLTRNLYTLQVAVAVFTFLDTLNRRQQSIKLWVMMKVVKQQGKTNKLVAIAFMLTLFLPNSPSAQGVFLSGEDLVSAKMVENMSIYYPGSSGYLAIVAEIADGWHINSHKPIDKFLIPTEVKVVAPEGIEIEQILYPEPVMEKLGISDEKMSLYKGKVIFGIKFKMADNLPEGSYTIKATLRYQGCNNLTCIEPATKELKKKITIGSITQGAEAINPEIFSSPIFTKSVATGKTEEGKEEGIAGVIEKKGLLLAFIFIFIGGLALDLTPCIYPIIPITVSYFGGQAQGKTSRIFTLAVIYVLGMSLTYSILGTIAAMTGSLFGSALQNPWVIGGIAVVLVVLATSMFDLWEIRMPMFLTRRTGESS